MSQAAHALENLQLAAVLPLAPEAYQELFQPRRPCLKSR
jgi:hypothetical protein